MDIIKRYSGKALIHFFKYFICPFLIFLSILFLLLVGLNYWAKNPAVAPYSAFAEFASLLSLLIALFIFIFKTMDALLIRNPKAQSFFERQDNKIKIRISISTRISLKPYLLIVAVSMLFIAIAFLLISYQTHTTLSGSSGDFWAVLGFYAISLCSLSAYVTCYKPEEKVIFHLDRFFRTMDFCCREPRIRLSARDFKDALKAYQKILPDFYSLKNLEEKVRQTDLILKRGTPQEIRELQLFVHSLSDSIKMYDASLFREIFNGLCLFLKTNENEEMTILQINETDKDKLWHLASKHGVPLLLSFIAAVSVSSVTSLVTSQPLSYFAIEIVTETFVLFGAWESRSKQ